MTTTIGDIFTIPEAVHQGDFVLRLTEGLQADKRRQTLQQYVVTPQLVQSFKQALSLIGSAVNGNSSKGAYLHGSFGSGKSHFMAVLDMILEGDADARAIPELAGVVREANAWWEGGSYLVVPFHMIGARSMEQAILGGYAAHVREKHPDAPTPGFYRSAELIQNAHRLRGQMGDESFFKALGGSGGGDGGWGSLGGGWDAMAYEAAAAANPDDAEHRRLVGDLVDAFFSHLHANADTDNYVSLDRGLAVMSQHARDLGYRAVVLFLDELILWLASHSQDQGFLNREGQKVAKLVEAEAADRPIPIVSFIARQRDLRELVGASVPGAQQLAFADVLQWWEARFDEIKLEDRNLPAIIERRLLQPRGEAEKQQLHEAFEKTARVRQEVLDILLTHEGDKQMFEQVYPFSPALVQVLVALSGLLQRERTALKLMLQLLVQNKDRLQLGDVIPVGDLFDAIIDGDEPFTPVIKNLFDRARQVWNRKLVPLLEADHGVSNQDILDGNADPQVIRRYRADAGILKTLLLSTLAPEVEALRNLTPTRLAALNHGTIRSPLPNGEAGTVLAKVRGWASHAGEIQLSADAVHPVISMQLSGVDVEGVLENARAMDNFGNRVRLVKDLLFGEIGIDASTALLAPEYSWLWRGTPRRTEVLLQNVRELTDESMRPGDGVWRLLIDYPFDEDPARTPADDRARLQTFRERAESVRTIAWIPSFLNERALDDLGRLVILNHVLSGPRLDEYGAHLQPVERTEARATLKSQRDQLELRVRGALKQAYGIAQGTGNDVHTSHTLDEHFQSLAGGLRLQPPPGGGFKESVEHLLDQALAHQYPAHPKFEGEVRRAALKWSLDALREAVDSPNGRADLERGRRDEIRRIVQPLNLARCGEAQLSPEDHWRTHFTRKMAAEGVKNPTVRQLRQWIDEPQAMGLQDDVSDLIILGWAAQAGRTPYLHGGPVQAEVGGLQRECELREQALPDEALWKEAVRRASDIFGEVGTGAGRNPGNVASMVQALRRHAGEKMGAVRDYRAALETRLGDWGVKGDCARMRTAQASLDLLIALADASADTVAVLAQGRVDTSSAAMGAVMASAPTLTATLRSPQWQVLETFRGLGRSDAPAVAVIEAAVAALASDEHVIRLDAELSRQHGAALKLMVAPPPPLPPPPPPRPSPSIRNIERRSADAAAVTEVMQTLQQALQEDASLRVDIDCRVYREGDGGA
ncbi:phage resistance protein [Luteimonas yindakuii]|uniref:phage resistance protein n=1 Tax=Luteimonas yindakuii TaxID=2565782 RepID=UPI0010A5A187|nr:phage resistance protein [Luteimonas yindakuii]QCO67005.1 phage resistance protein [Luteimonas yindakuii]